MVKRILFLLLILLHLGVASVFSQVKRECRGAWIQCVNGQFQGLGTATMQSTLSYQLNELQKDGVNTIIFQVRPECDALYESPYEPWSRFLTGRHRGSIGLDAVWRYGWKPTPVCSSSLHGRD